MRCVQTHQLLRRARFFARRLRRNARGVAALEFTLIMPLLLMLIIGTLEFGHAITIDRRVSQVSSSIADLVSRSEMITTGELDYIAQGIAASIMAPYDAGPLTVNIVSVHAKSDDATATKVCWSYDHAGEVPYAKTVDYPIPAGLLSPGSSVIVGEVTYNYQPLLFSAQEAEDLTGVEATPETAITKAAYTMTERFYLSPRTSSCVSQGAGPANNCTTSCADLWPPSP